YTGPDGSANAAAGTDSISAVTATCAAAYRTARPVIREARTRAVTRPVPGARAVRWLAAGPAMDLRGMELSRCRSGRRADMGGEPGWVTSRPARSRAYRSGQWGPPRGGRTGDYGPAGGGTSLTGCGGDQRRGVSAIAERGHPEPWPTCLRPGGGRERPPPTGP